MRQAEHVEWNLTAHKCVLERLIRCIFVQPKAAVASSWSRESVFLEVNVANSWSGE
jgi:hypothetical protein